MKPTLLTTLFALALTLSPQLQAQALTPQNPDSIEVTAKNAATITAITNRGTYDFHIDNTGSRDVTAAMQAMFNKLNKLQDLSATINFSPGIYRLESPLRIKMCSLKMVGNGHSGVEIHGANLESGTIFRLGKGAAPHAIIFEYAGRSKSFPAAEKPWPYTGLKVELENLAFVGYNNTGVDTDKGYSRFRGDKPNFRELNWYPSPDRYKDVEKEGQRALYFPAGSGKCELLRVTGCYFTDLFIGLEVANCDVSYINKNWFAQLAIGMRLRGDGQGMMVSENLFADLETALQLARPNFSTYSNNVFVYVSKCFEFDTISNSTITGNTLYNPAMSKGTASFGGFCYAKRSYNLSVQANSITQQLDSRKKTTTLDKEPNGQSFIQFDNSNRLMFANNIVNTIITQTVVRLNNCSNSVVSDNIITHGSGGNDVAETGECTNNFYRPIRKEDSKPFNTFKY